MITMQEIVSRRNSGQLDHLGFDDHDFYFASFVGPVSELDGEYIRTDEPDYPAYGMSIMVINLTNQNLPAANLIEKICAGKPWMLVQWIMDTGNMIEHVCHGSRWRDYGVKFDVKYKNIGQCFYNDLARKYREELCT